MSWQPNWERCGFIVGPLDYATASDLAPFLPRPCQERPLMQEELECARTLAVRAGAILLKHYSAPDVHWKGRGNPVTEADRAANAFIVERLHRLFPEDGI